jgi:hypothetical protein
MIIWSIYVCPGEIYKNRLRRVRESTHMRLFRLLSEACPFSHAMHRCKYFCTIYTGFTIVGNQDVMKWDTESMVMKRFNKIFGSFHYWRCCINYLFVENIQKLQNPRIPPWELLE